MKKNIVILTIILTQSLSLFSQNIPSSRITNWKSPGSLPPFNFQHSVTLTNYGADTTGIIASDTALQLAIAAINGAGEIYVPKGNYLFLQAINIPDSTIIRGEVDTLNVPLAFFKLSPGANHGIIINGNEMAINDTIMDSLIGGQQQITVNHPLLFAVGDFIKLRAYDDSLLVTSNWAYGSTGQIFQITQINGNDLLLNKPLRRSYITTRLPSIYKITPRQQVHIKCIKIERLDTTSSQSANIFINFAADCSLSGIESNYCNYAHVLIQNSCRVTVENSFFQNGFSYGDGGKAYGTLLQFTTGDCYIHQNNFNHLRHSMILQAGANGNVFAYNYSIDPFWTGVSLPANSAGDITLHGNYVYMNLFESNIIQNIVIDNSHGQNGPFNTFFRNKAELWGIFMNQSAGNQQNFIGNQVTNTGFFPYGYYALEGTGHFEYGNMIKGTLTPSQTNEPNDTTMFGYTFGSFYNTISSIPPIINNNWQSTDPLIESLYRYQISGKKTICGEITYTTPSLILDGLEANEKFEIYPNPFSDEFIFKNKSDKTNLSIKIYNTLGKLVYAKHVSDKNNTINFNDAKPGMYFLQIEGAAKHAFKILKY